MLSVYELKLRYILQRAHGTDSDCFRDYMFFDTGRSALFFFIKNVLAAPGQFTVYVNAYTTDTVHATLRSLGVKVVPLDVDPFTLVPINKGFKFDRQSVVIHTGLFGFSCFNFEIYNQVKKAGGLFVEDSCNSYGTLINGHEAGSLGDASFFSFRVGKAFSSSGGALKINSPACLRLTELYEKIKQPSRINSISSLYRCYLDYVLFEPWVLRNISRPMREMQKKVPALSAFVRGGVVDTMLKVSEDSLSKMGYAQVKFLLKRHKNFRNEMLEKKAVSDRLIAGLRDVPSLYVYGCNPENYNGWNYLFFPVLLQRDTPDTFIAALRKRGFDAARFHYNVPKNSFPSTDREELKGTYSLVDRLVCIPNTTRLLGKEEKLINAVKEALKFS